MVVLALPGTRKQNSKNVQPLLSLCLIPCGTGRWFFGRQAARRPVGRLPKTVWYIAIATNVVAISLLSQSLYYRNLSIQHGFGQLKNEWNLTISCWELINLGVVGIKICPKPCKVCPKPWNTWKWPVFQLQLTQNQWKSFCKSAQNRGTLPKTVGHVKMACFSIATYTKSMKKFLQICPKPWDSAQNRGTR